MLISNIVSLGIRLIRFSIGPRESRWFSDTSFISLLDEVEREDHWKVAPTSYDLRYGSFELSEIAGVN